MLPARLPSTADWHPRLPFPSVLPQVAAILHHGGIGTAVRALHTGTPQVIMAYGADRPDNAARLAAHEVARWVAEPDWTPPRSRRTWRPPRRTPATAARAARLLDEPEDAGPDRAAATLEGLLSAAPPRLTPEQRRLLARRLAARR